MGRQWITATEAEGVMTITLNRPDVMNAPNRGLRRQRLFPRRHGRRFWKNAAHGSTGAG